MLSPYDTKQISDYFHLLGRMARSTAGPQLEVLRLFAVKHQRSPDVAELRERLRAIRTGPHAARDHALELAIERQAEAAEAITARPTRETREYARESVDDETLAALGRTGRRLQRVREADPVSYDVLEALCGDSGALWASSNEGSIGALLIFTAAGRKMLAKSKRETPNLSLSDQERLLNATAAKDTKTRLAMDEARIQMHALLERACRCWADTAPPRKVW